MTPPELTELLENLNFIAGDAASHKYLRLLAGLSVEAITELHEENSKLKGELVEVSHPEIHRFDLGLDAFSHDKSILVKPEGKYVLYSDYLWMSNYADRLVEFAGLPCLPADLENLRAANAAMATEIDEIQSQLAKMQEELMSAVD